MITICGRYYLKISIDKLIEKYGIIKNTIDFKPLSNIYPSQKAPIILNEGTNSIKLYKWGFSPSYTRNLIINARAETLEQKKTFKKPFKKQRCVIPVSGFYEWKKQGDKKIKHRIYLKNQEIFSLAGLYDNFIDKSGESIKTFTIITTKANKKVKEIHNRMPAILPNNNIIDWLNPQYNKTDELKDFLIPYAKDDLIIEAELENKQMSLDF